MSRFDELIYRTGMKRREVADRLGVHPDTVSRWGKDAPQYAIAYLQLYAKVQDALK